MVWVVVVIVALAAAIDVRDHLRRRRRRGVADMLRRRHDELADIWATQHAGIAIPMHDVHKHRDDLG